MANSQAVLLLCSDMELTNEFHNFVDSKLNLYSFTQIQKDDLTILIMSEGEAREELFREMQDVFDSEGTRTVIIFGHRPCLDKDLTQSKHETQLRHSVSVIRARFPEKEISAYLVTAQGNYSTFNQVA